MTRLRRLVAALLLGTLAVSTGCSMEAKVDDRGDGVRVDGDVDKQEP